MARAYSLDLRERVVDGARSWCRPCGSEGFDKGTEVAPAAFRGNINRTRPN